MNILKRTECTHEQAFLCARTHTSYACTSQNWTTMQANTSARVVASWARALVEDANSECTNICFVFSWVIHMHSCVVPVNQRWLVCVSSTSVLLCGACVRLRVAGVCSAGVRVWSTNVCAYLCSCVYTHVFVCWSCSPVCTECVQCLCTCVLVCCTYRIMSAIFMDMDSWICVIGVDVYDMWICTRVLVCRTYRNNECSTTLDIYVPECLWIVLMKSAMECVDWKYPLQVWGSSWMASVSNSKQNETNEVPDCTSKSWGSHSVNS